MKISYHNLMLLLAGSMLACGCTRQTESVENVPVQVKVMTTACASATPQRTFSGTIEEQTGSALGFAVAGTVKAVYVNAGERVRQGQLLAVLDDTAFKSSCEMARATLDQAQDAYKRLKQLHDSNSLPEVQWVEVESKLRQAQSAYDIAEKNLKDTKLHAPFSGYIAEKNVSAGNCVMPGSPAVKLVTVDNVKVCISVPENEISNIGLGNKVRITVPALGNREFEGVVAEKDVSANALSRSYNVKALVRNSDAALLPGMLCTLVLDPSSVEHNAIAVPRHAVGLDSDNRNFVWIDDNGHARKTYVSLGGFVGDSVIIASGLTPGQHVVVDGQQKISENMSITTR
jgi:RND family efflux transporter MFP subunit